MAVLETKTKNAKTTTKRGKQNGGERKIGLFQRKKRERERKKKTDFDLFSSVSTMELVSTVERN